MRTEPGRTPCSCGHSARCGRGSRRERERTAPPRAMHAPSSAVRRRRKCRRASRLRAPCEQSAARRRKREKRYTARPARRSSEPLRSREQAEHRPCSRQSESIRGRSRRRVVHTQREGGESPQSTTPARDDQCATIFAPTASNIGAGASNLSSECRPRRSAPNRRPSARPRGEERRDPDAGRNLRHHLLTRGRGQMERGSLPRRRTEE